jgi:hypothetical protein
VVVVMTVELLLLLLLLLPDVVVEGDGEGVEGDGEGVEGVDGEDERVNDGVVFEVGVVDVVEVRLKKEFAVCRRCFENVKEDLATLLR